MARDSCPPSTFVGCVLLVSVYSLWCLLRSAVDAGIKFRFTAEELKKIGPNFEKKWNEYYADKPDSPAMCLLLVSMSVILTASLTSWLTMTL